VRNRITAVAIATAASVALIGGTGQAFADSQAPAKPAAPSKLTVGAYKAWLKKAPGGLSTLAKFAKLPKAKQQAFVNYLQDANVIKAFKADHSGDIPKGGKKTVFYKKKDVAFVSTVTSTARKNDNGTTTLKLSVTATERIFDIPVTSVTTQLAYQVGKDHLVNGKGQTVSNTSRNHNAAFAFKASKGKIEPEANMLDGVTNWTATPKFRSAGTKSVNKVQVAIGLGDHGWSHGFINGKR
jgi:flagellar basal body rod protein FlgB